MSGALSVAAGVVPTVAAVGNAINALAGLAFGATGGVVLGDFAFSGFEVPEYIAIGGAQATTVHKLPGGERVVDLMGPDEGDLDWSGTLIDNDPESRAQVLDQMRIDGDPLPLTWGPFFYTVVIKSFKAESRYSMLKYSISCLVLVNEAALPPPSDPDTQTAVTSDLNSAADAAPPSGAPSVAAAQDAALPTPPVPPGEPLPVPPVPPAAPAAADYGGGATPPAAAPPLAPVPDLAAPYGNATTAGVNYTPGITY